MRRHVIRTLGARERVVYSHPADDGPPLEDLDRLIARAEFLAEWQWRDDHGDLPWDTGRYIGWGAGDPAVRELLSWPRRWFTDHLFELPPLGQVPQRWLDLL